MNVLSQLLDERENRAGGRDDGELLAWLNQGVAPEVRLLKFDAWLARELAVRLDWKWAGEAKAKRIEQCRVYMERLVLEMWRRGWMLDGKRLAKHLQTVLDSMGAYQRAGKVVEFWPYFRACVDRYVGANAEEIQIEARSVGAQMSQLMNVLAIQRPASTSSLPELVAQRAEEVLKAKAATLREKLAKERGRRKAGERQEQLL